MDTEGTVAAPFQGVDFHEYIIDYHKVVKAQNPPGTGLGTCMFQTIPGPVPGGPPTVGFVTSPIPRGNLLLTGEPAVTYTGSCHPGFFNITTDAGQFAPAVGFAFPALIPGRPLDFSWNASIDFYYIDTAGGVNFSLSTINYQGSWPKLFPPNTGAIQQVAGEGGALVATSSPGLAGGVTTGGSGSITSDGTTIRVLNPFPQQVGILFEGVAHGIAIVAVLNAGITFSY